MEVIIEEIKSCLNKHSERILIYYIVKKYKIIPFQEMSSSKKKKTKRLDTSVSAAKHFESENIQTKLRSYASCPQFTAEGKLCRSSFSTNKFIDPVTKKKTDCNWYCLQNCSAKNLRPMFNIPKFMFATSGERIPVESVSYTFSAATTTRLIFEINHAPDPKGILWTSNDTEQRKTIVDRGSDLNMLAEKLCQWFRRRQDLNTDIKLTCLVNPEDEDFFDTHDFSRFDIPFIRPNSMWSSHYYITTTFEITRKKELDK
jgi:hypothetical protein